MKHDFCPASLGKVSVIHARGSQNRLIESRDRVYFRSRALFTVASTREHTRPALFSPTPLQALSWRGSSLSALQEGSLCWWGPNNGTGYERLVHAIVGRGSFSARGKASVLDPFSARPHLPGAMPPAAPNCARFCSRDAPWQRMIVMAIDKCSSKQ